jgi:hypothetical protein
VLVFDNVETHVDERFVVLGDQRNAALVEARIGSQARWQTVLLADDCEHLVVECLFDGLVLFNGFSLLGQRGVRGVHTGCFYREIFLVFCKFQKRWQIRFF